MTGTAFEPTPPARREARTASLPLPLADPGPAAPVPALPPAASRLVEAVRKGTAGGLLPPLTAPGPGHTAMPAGHLAGAADARRLAAALSRPACRPLLDLLEELESWCARTAPTASGVLAPGVLSPLDPGLFGPLVCEVFTVCATGNEERAGRFAALRGAQYRAFLALFLDRLRRDLADGWPAAEALRGPATGLEAHGEETHNGGQRVLRVRLAGGGAVAYKPRPASGEVLLLAETDSLFALLNELPPASGPVRLPLLACWRGRGEDRHAYSWQEWVEPPGPYRVLRREGPWELTGTVLEPGEARRYWHRAGALAAACFGWGVVDLSGSNVLAGELPGGDGPLAFPVDLESCLVGVARLADTGLIHDPAAGGHHHPGLENEARWCDVDGTPAGWRRDDDGNLLLARRREPRGRTETRAVVAGTDGSTGYGPHLPAMLRGMFDAWTLLCRHRERAAAFLAEHAPDHYLRIIPRPTSDYYEELLMRRGLGPDTGTEAAGFAPQELEQLAREDVPYFFRTASGGPLLSMDPPPAAARFVPARLRQDMGPAWPPDPGRVTGEQFTLAGLGIALRDAIGYVFEQIPGHHAEDTEYGVRWELPAPLEGQVSFDWPDAGRRIVYRWDARRTRLLVEDLAAPPSPLPPSAAGEIRRRLLRLDRVDTALRGPWTASGFTDTALEEKLRRLTGSGLAWLRTVVAEHGWPGRSLVGERAADIACRLVQHAEGDTGFRAHCLELVRQAAREGEMPRRDIAYLTDALRLAQGRPQLYGTKFERVDGVFRPLALEDPERVDERRAALGMEPLDQYAEVLRTRFAPAVDPPPGTTAGTTPGGTTDSTEPSGTGKE
ncbi:hypothetical protein GCM10009716_17500 [Streptomyces sodiiphilus]|uniref:Lantibiotic biosynthesis protein dehydration domain-containing protein n=1 Tax=Streptomyces sodiiphilus TaxID=226217 RepID=A0ABN2P0T1_9ACTN